MKHLKPKRINFIEGLRDDPVINVARSRRAWLILPAALLLVVMAGVEMQLLLLQLQPAREEIAGLDLYLGNAQNQEQYLEAQQLQAENAALRESGQELQRLYFAINSYPEFSGALYRSVNNTAARLPVTLNYYQYQRESGLLYLDCRTDRVTQAADYAADLRALGLFTAIGYYGYNLDAGNGYYFYVQAQVAAEGGI